ncbi:GuaB3 family IMP dehydrogenase-related protein [Alloscardovia venturai]|uniref:GuaB3 family IMP dehydrogenase-related protein n=1 Tax=Alloscardovia venturai TaxID=1769421 RepID=A0ABW2Y3W9_9BIFI
MTQEIEIGMGKSGRMCYALDDVAIVPTRRTRDPQDVDTSWQVDAYQFDIPVMGAPMDSSMSPETVIKLGKLGGLGVLDLEGLWTRYEDPSKQLEEIAHVAPEEATALLQKLYAQPIRAELITARIQQIREAGVTVAGALTPQRTQEFYSTVVDAGVDLFVIRGTAVSAEHISITHEPLNLKKFIYELDVPVIVGGAGTYRAAMHLMRTGAAGVLVGTGGSAVSSSRSILGMHVPMATAIADIAAARKDYMEESDGRYVQVIADGGMGNTGNFVKAFAMGADAVMVGTMLARATDAPGQGTHWGREATHASLPRGRRATLEQVGTMEEILMGPSTRADGSMNYIGALRRAMASTGYTTLRQFQNCPVVATPYDHR